MQKAISSPLIDSVASSRERIAEIVTVAAVLVIAAGVYGLLFNRANVLSYSIGYNLYAAERVMEGAVPYRDFHTLYPPATFWLNAALFRWLGVSMYTALLGVLSFKVLTVMMIYLSGRQVMPRVWALMAALSALLWLRPNGPFKSVPMHYGALFLALAMYLLLKYENRRRLLMVFLAGASLGVVVLFKHNIGAYALAGSLVLLLYRRPSVASPHSNTNPSLGGRSYGPLVLLLGCATAVAPALAYMVANRALAPMIKTLFFGPGEFLLNRLAVPLSPAAPILLVAALAVTAYLARRLRTHRPLPVLLWLILIAATTVFLLRGSQAEINQIIFYLPMLALGCGLFVALLAKELSVTRRRNLLIVVVFAAASLMELFPRFAREQSIAAMPFVTLALFYLLNALRPAIRKFSVGTTEYLLALAVVPTLFVLMEGRVFFNTYFERGLRLKATIELTVERGRRVLFPTATASLIDNVVNYIQQRVPAGGYAFAQSDAGSSFLFLSERRNVSNAQFWIGVGVTDQERAATLERIDKTQTKLIITSDEVLEAEKYEPMRDYINRNFNASVRFDDVLILYRE
jgi:Dolichyl-phosphate-mannose-protein mannosyltransferase